MVVNDKYGLLSYQDMIGMYLDYAASTPGSTALTREEYISWLFLKSHNLPSDTWHPLFRRQLQEALDMYPYDDQEKILDALVMTLAHTATLKERTKDSSYE